MNYTDKVIRQSNYWYNDGLKRANFRDLSGAIVSLRRSLQYYRQNIAARNLLGLVYYGRGEINEALVEWIISKNLRPRDNVANYFIKKIQAAPAKLERMNINIKKYNQCLTYCNQDAEDLAFIQVKKVIVGHPNFVKAYQLLALLSIRKGQYSRVKQALKKAHKIDTTDAITLYYLNELSELRASGHKSTEDKELGHVYTVGNETIIQPTSATLKENAGMIAIVNVVVGILIGVAVMTFLIEPTLLEKEALLNADAIREYSKEIDVQDAEISALKTELDTYRTTQDEAEIAIETVGNTQSTYEILVKVLEQLEAEDTSDSNMSNSLLEVNQNLLGEEGQELYENLADTIFSRVCEGIYEDALDYNESEDYEAAIVELEEIMTMLPSYDSYNAMYLLAQLYERENDMEQAELYYNRVVDEGTGYEAADNAVIALESIESGGSSLSLTTNDEDSTDDVDDTEE